MAYALRKNVRSICLATNACAQQLLARPVVNQPLLHQMPVQVTRLDRTQRAAGFVEVGLVLHRTHQLIKNGQLTSLVAKAIMPFANSDCFAKKRDIEHVLNTIKENVAKKDIVFYNAYVEALIDSKIQFSFDDILQMMEESNVSPDAAILVKFVAHSLKTNNLDIAKNFFNYMKSVKMNIPNEYYALLAKAKCARGDGTWIDKFLKQITENSFFNWADIAVVSEGFLDANDFDNFELIIKKYHDNVDRKMPLKFALPLIAALSTKKEISLMTDLARNHVAFTTQTDFLRFVDAVDAKGCSVVLKELYAHVNFKFSLAFDRIADAYLFDVVQLAENVETVFEEIQFLQPYHPEADLYMMALPHIAQFKRSLLQEYLIKSEKNLVIKPHFLLPLVDGPSASFDEALQKVSPGYDKGLLTENETISISSDQQIKSSLSMLLKKYFEDETLHPKQVSEDFMDHVKDIPKTNQNNLLSYVLFFSGCTAVISGKYMQKFKNLLVEMDARGFQFDTNFLLWCYKTLSPSTAVKMELIYGEGIGSNFLKNGFAYSKINQSLKKVISEIKYETPGNETLLICALNHYRKSPDVLKKFEDILMDENVHKDPCCSDVLFWHFIGTGNNLQLEKHFSDYNLESDLTIIPVKYLRSWSEGIEKFLMQRLSDSMSESRAKWILFLSLVEAENIDAAAHLLSTEGSSQEIITLLADWQQNVVHDENFGPKCKYVLQSIKPILDESNYVFLVDNLLLSMIRLQSIDTQNVEMVFQSIPDDIQSNISANTIEALLEHFLHLKIEPPAVLCESPVLRNLINAAFKGEWSAEDYLKQIELLVKEGKPVPDGLLGVVIQNIPSGDLETFGTRLEEIIPGFEMKSLSDWIIARTKAVLQTSGVKQAIDFVNANAEKYERKNKFMWNQVFESICEEVHNQNESDLMDLVVNAFSFDGVEPLVNAHVSYNALTNGKNVISEVLTDVLAMRELVKVILNRKDEKAMNSLKSMVVNEEAAHINFVAALVTNNVDSQLTAKEIRAIPAKGLLTFISHVYAVPNDVQMLLNVDSQMRNVCPMTKELNLALTNAGLGLGGFNSSVFVQHFEKQFFALPCIFNHAKVFKKYKLLNTKILFRVRSHGAQNNNSAGRNDSNEIVEELLKSF